MPSDKFDQRNCASNGHQDSTMVAPRNIIDTSSLQTRLKIWQDEVDEATVSVGGRPSKPTQHDRHRRLAGGAIQLKNLSGI